MSPNSNLDALFKAKSIALVGVSAETTKIGSVMLNNLIQGGYEGKIFLVNPKYKTLYERPCYPTLSAIPEDVDCACIAIPADFVKKSLLDAEEKGVKAVVIITAGFGEKGPDGKDAEHEFVEIADRSGMKILGPNCLGFMNLPGNINLSFAATSPEKGDIALISQSGAICTAILDLAEKDDLGFSYAISVGNKCDISETTLLPYLLQDENTKVIGAYLEDMLYGRKLLNRYCESRNSKPFIVIKPGTSAAGKKAIGSHTGAIMGSTISLTTSLAQFGIIQAESLNEFYHLLQCFSQCKPMLGENVIIVTNAGGPGILATDSIVEAGLSLAQISDASRNSLVTVLPTEASIRNPIDILGDAKADRFQKALSILSTEDNVDAILVIITPQFVTEMEKTCEEIARISKESNKTIIPILLGNFIVEKGKNILRKAGVAYLTEIRTAVNVLKKMALYTRQKNELLKNPPTSYQPQSKKLLSVDTQLQKTAETVELLSRYSIPQPKQTLAITLQEALNWATIRYPVVLKVPTEIAAHKTEIRGVILNIKNDDDLKTAWQEVRKNFKGEFPLLLQVQLKYEEEFFLGATHDDSFGHLMVFGRGGIYTQIYNDYGYTLVPATRQQILEALSKTTMSKILVGARGKPPLPVALLVETIEKFQQLLLDNPSIASLDCNPILIMKDSISAVDVKVYLEK